MFGRKKNNSNMSPDDVEELRKFREERAILIDIKTEGRAHIFTYWKNDQLFTIETYGTLADDVAGWKRNAGLS